MKYKNSNLLLIFFILLSHCSFGNSDDVEESIASTTISTATSTTTTVAIPPSTSTTTLVIEEGCVEGNNQNTNFEKTINVQIFLNKYGFDAGDEDGYLGQQTADAIRDVQA